MLFATTQHNLALWIVYIYYSGVVGCKFHWPSIRAAAL